MPPPKWFFAAASLLLAAYLAQATDEVAQYRNNPQHNGVFPAMTFTDRPYLKWRFKTGNKVRSTAVISGNTLVVGSDDGQVYCLNATSGRLQWSFKTRGRVASSPAIAKGNVYFESGDLGVYAVSLATGKQVWKFTLGPELPPSYRFPAEFAPPDFMQWDYYLSSPTIVEDRLYIGGDGKLYALDLATGKAVWSFDAKGRIRTAPAADAGVVYVGTMAGHLFAVDARTGQEKWRFKTLGNPDFPEGAIQSTPAAADGLVYFGSRDSFVYAVQTSDGQLRWKFSHKGSWVITPPTVADGFVYVGSSDGRFVQSLDAKTGEERGHEAVTGNVFGAVAISGRFAVSTEWDGAAIWRDARTGRINSPPVLHNDLIYVGCDDDYVYAIGFAAAAAN